MHLVHIVKTWLTRILTYPQPLLLSSEPHQDYIVFNELNSSKPFLNNDSLLEAISSFRDISAIGYNIRRDTVHTSYQPPLVESFVTRLNSELRHTLKDIEFVGIYGHQELRVALSEFVLWPKHFAHIYKKLGVMPELGVLLYGPPGKRSL